MGWFGLRRGGLPFSLKGLVVSQKKVMSIRIIQTKKNKCLLTERQTDRQTDRQNDRQNDRQTDKRTESLAEELRT